MAQRIALIGRIHSLRLTDADVAFSLHVNYHGHGTDYHCSSNRPEIIRTAAVLEPNRLIGVVAVISTKSGTDTLHVERLELLGRKVREQVAA